MGCVFVGGCGKAQANIAFLGVVFFALVIDTKKNVYGAKNKNVY